MNGSERFTYLSPSPTDCGGPGCRWSIPPQPFLATDHGPCVVAETTDDHCQIAACPASPSDHPNLVAISGPVLACQRTRHRWLTHFDPVLVTLCSRILNRLCRQQPRARTHQPSVSRRIAISSGNTSCRCYTHCCRRRVYDFSGTLADTRGMLCSPSFARLAQPCWC